MEGMIATELGERPQGSESDWRCEAEPGEHVLEHAQ